MGEIIALEKGLNKKWYIQNFGGKNKNVYNK